MSRVIENDHLWNEDEVAYKLARNLQDEVDQNKAAFEGKEVKPVQLELDPEVFEFVKALDDEQLSDALKERGIEVNGRPTKELKMALAQAIQKSKNDG